MLVQVLGGEAGVKVDEQGVCVLLGVLCVCSLATCEGIDSLYADHTRVVIVQTGETGTTPSPPSIM